ncbi:Autophagy protein 7 [Mactra antiquata]
MTQESNVLQFVPFNSFLDGGFWHKLSDNKLNHYGLDESIKPLTAWYYNGDSTGMPCRMNLEYTAFDNVGPPARCFRAHGNLYNKNTLDSFKEADKKQLLEELGSEIWKAVTTGSAITDPSKLSQFVLLAFADLKKYHYYFWFAFPAICPKTDFTLVKKPSKLSDKFSTEQISQLIDSYNNFQNSLKEYVGYFIIVEDTNTLIIDQLENTQKYLDDGKKVLFGFADPSTVESHPGWPLRNYLSLISYHWCKQLNNKVDIICFRYVSQAGIHNIGHSLYLTVNISTMSDIQDIPKCVGWEKNERQKLGPRFVNLSSSMDPSRLAESAVDLNLKLMRWRLLPELDLDVISQTKCLLLGAGTLGCNVARCLLGWGVRNITFIDNGRVSYSNPVRQTLFVFNDCKETAGGLLKAEAAADSLKKIFPGVNATGVNISIPMPGHTITDGAIKQTKDDIETLEKLVSAHDAIFLLLDTRESRWLPTLMAASKQKTVICAALGFDTFLVMRHGNQSYTDTGTSNVNIPLSQPIPGNHLGCYFCNDVVAPGDSTRDRTLDQQCTVSRPGMSFIASALAVELLVSLLQHKDKQTAPADTGVNDEINTECSLGLVPHQIRGFLSRYQQIMPASRAFDKCTACSKTVVQAYKDGGIEFLLKAFNEPHYLEDLTGLTLMHQETADAEVWDFDDEEEFSSMDTQ